MDNQIEGKVLKYLVAPEMSSKTLKREVAHTTSVKGRRKSKSNLKKQSKRTTKSSRTYEYEYEVKSCLTWEFADVVQSIDNWHESLKGDASEPVKIEPQLMNISNWQESLKGEDYSKQLVEIQQHESLKGEDSEKQIRQQMTNKETIDEIPFDEYCMENTRTGDDRQLVTTHSTAPKNSVNVQNDATDDNLVGTVDEISPVPSDHICYEERFEETNEKSRRSPRYLNRKSMNNEVIRNPGACDDLDIGTPEVNGPKMLEHQSLFINVGENNSTIGVETHANQKQYMNSPVLVRREKPYWCTHCPQRFVRKSYLMRHQRIHSGEKPFKCSECPQAFSQKSSLTTHQRIHSGEKPFKCMECPKMFSQKVHLKTHQLIHSGEKPFKCLECPQRFSQKSNLTTHQRIHSGERPFKCMECPKMFSRKTLLMRHQCIHSGEKPFKCTDCPKKFSDPSTLQRHLRIHTGEKPFKCSECPKMFSHKISLTTHQHIHSGGKPFK